jgi:hypothetical protein
MKLFIIYVIPFALLPPLIFVLGAENSPQFSINILPRGALFPENCVLHLERETMQENRKIIVFVSFNIYVFILQKAR